MHTLSFRAERAAFADQRVWLTGTPAGGVARMAAVRGDHAVAMTLDAEVS